jgi:hypothetical protein
VSPDPTLTLKVRELGDAVSPFPPLAEMVTGMLTCPTGVVTSTVPESFVKLRNAVFTVTCKEPVAIGLAESQP